eukprot:TRINITY_DN24453_c0_g1_i1.p1 TRINITY_DN24453_c0_g1~~TRINITY_DN24453_c0_g1_i1.p1  ORF type:complete len:476 (-),score=108.25 TRINITY_DN24453_c0_g1_i1:761-2188(-)
MEVSFRDISFKIVEKKGKGGRIEEKRQEELDQSSSVNEPEWKTILSPISGTFYPGTINAILGPSGAGKTTLLDCLSLRTSTTSKSLSTGEIFLDGEKATSEQISFSTGFVWQTDVLLPTATVKETVLTAARLKLPNSIPREEKLARVEKVIEVLRLGKCMNQKIGGGKIPEISGGEKRRTTIAVELVTSPKVLFMDEATSGLDSSTAVGLIRLLRHLSRRLNMTIVMSIHQPSAIMLPLFDTVMLLTEGERFYHGRADMVVQFLEDIRSPCPQFTNPFDHLMDLATIWGDSNGIDELSFDMASFSESTFDLEARSKGPSSLEGPVATSPNGVFLAHDDGKTEDDWDRVHKIMDYFQENESIYAFKPSTEQCEKFSYDNTLEGASEIGNVSPAKPAEDNVPAGDTTTKGKDEQRSKVSLSSLTYANGFWCQLAILSSRVWINWIRDPSNLGEILGQHIFSSLFCGFLFFSIVKRHR